MSDDLFRHRLHGGLALAIALLAVFRITNGALWFAHMDLTPASVVRYDRGDGAAFLVFQILLAALLVFLGAFLARGRRVARREVAPDADPR